VAEADRDVDGDTDVAGVGAPEEIGKVVDEGEGQTRERRVGAGDDPAAAAAVDAEELQRERSGVAVVGELQGDAEVLVLDHRDDLLQIVAILSGHADLVFLDRGLHLDLAVLDETHDLPGLLDGDALLDGDLLPERAAGRLFHLAVVQGLERDATLVELRLEDIDDGLELHLVGHGQRDVGPLELHLVLRALEIVAGVDLAPRLIERVRDLLHVDLAHDVEGILRGHGRLSYLRGTVATPGGGTNVNRRSGSPPFTTSFVKRIVTVFSN